MKRNKKGRFVKRSSNPRKKHRAKRRANPHRRKHRAKRRANPRRHRKHRAHNPRRRRKHNPHRRHARRRNPRARRHRRHNPRFLGALQGGIVGTLQEGAMMGAGALVNSLILGFALPMLPTTFTTGYALSAVRISAATVLKMVGKKFGGRIGDQMGTGAIAVAMYLLFRDILVSMAPTLPLGDYEEISIDDTGNIAGYMDPAARLQGYLPDGSVARGTGMYMGRYMSGASEPDAAYQEFSDGYVLGMADGIDY